MNKYVLSALFAVGCQIRGLETWMQNYSWGKCEGKEKSVEP